MNRKEYKQKIKAINNKLYEAKRIAKQEKTLLLNDILNNYGLKLGDKLMCKEYDNYDKFIICDAYIDIHDKVLLGLAYIMPMTSQYTTLTPIKYVEVNQAVKENKDYDNLPKLHGFRYNDDCVKL